MKHLKSIFFYLFISLILLVAGVATYVYFNADEIKERAVRGLNAVVVSKIEVKKVSLSLFQRFPNTSLVLEGVTINDPVQKERFLCKDATVFLDFNSLDLLLGHYNLNHIGLQANFVRLVKHPSQWNYILWEPDSTANSADVNINLRSFDWQVDSLYLKVDGIYAESKTNGKLSFSNGLLSTNTDLGFANIFYKNKKYTLPPTEIRIDDFNPNNRQFLKAQFVNRHLQAVASQISEHTYALSGTCFQLQALAASMGQPNVPDLQGAIAFKFNATTNELTAPTNLQFDLKNVNWPKHNIQHLSGQISLPTKEALDVAKFNLSGAYNGFDVSIKSNTESTKDGAQVLHIMAKNAKLPFNSDALVLSAQLVEAKITLPPLSQIGADFGLQSIDIISGNLQGVQYHMAIQNQELELSGTAKVSNNSLVFEADNGLLNGNEIKVEANMPSIKPLFEKTPKLYLQIETTSAWLALNPLFETLENIGIDSNSVSTDPALDYNIEIVFDVDKLSYDKVVTAKAYGALRIRPQGVDISTFSAEAFDGKAFAKGFYSSDTEKLSLTGFVNNFSAEKVLKTFDNFQQEYVSFTNCRGSVDVNFDLKEVGFWNNHWGYSKFNVHMYNAELKNLPFLSDIKSAVKQNKFAKIILNEDELFEKLSFINLQEAKANVVLQNNTVFISEAIFRSPEINLNSAGEYYTNNEEVDFEFQLFIRDFFAKSVTEDNYYEPQTKGSKLKFYLRGSANDPDVGMMRREKNGIAKKRPAFQSEKNIENTPKGSTIFVVEESENPPEKTQGQKPKETEKKKSGWFKKMLEKGGSLEDTSKVEFGIE